MNTLHDFLFPAIPSGSCHSGVISMSSLSFSICVFFELKMGKFQIFLTIYLISPDYKWDSNVILHCILIFKTDCNFSFAALRDFTVKSWVLLGSSQTCSTNNMRRNITIALGDVDGTFCLHCHHICCCHKDIILS